MAKKMGRPIKHEKPMTMVFSFRTTSEEQKLLQDSGGEFIKLVAIEVAKKMRAKKKKVGILDITNPQKPEVIVAEEGGEDETKKAE